MRQDFRILQFVVCLISSAASALPADKLPSAVDRKIEFERDVAPILRSSCVECHGPNLELGSLRLDDKKLALAGEVIEPGRSEQSLLIKRLIKDDRLGIRMPPTGPSLEAEQIGILRAWIDQGAQWPDGVELAAKSAQGPNDTRLAPVFAAIREADARRLQRLLRDPELARMSRSDGMTPLIFAAQFSSPAIVELLLKRGADPHSATKDGFTALMAGATSQAKTRLLLDHDADPTATSKFGLTALEVASRAPGNTETLHLLLERGAKLAPAALANAAFTGDLTSLNLLLQRGAEVNADRGAALGAAAYAGHLQMVERLLAAGAEVHPANHAGVVREAAMHGHGGIVELLVARGAEVNRPGGRDRYTVLMDASDSDYLPVETVRFLLGKGANPN